MPTTETKAIERRATQCPVCLSTTDDEMQPHVEGYGAVFYDPAVPGTEYKIFDDMVERIAPTAFARTLEQSSGCRCFVNHDPNMMLGRVDKGTMTLRCDSRGLFYTCQIPDTQVGRDTVENLRNGNLDGSSFNFSVTGQQWEDRKLDDGSILTIRTITDVDLYECGPVAMAAYAATSADIRSAEAAEDVRAQYNAWRNAEAVAVRLRTMDIAETLD